MSPESCSSGKAAFDKIFRRERVIRLMRAGLPVRCREFADEMSGIRSIFIFKIYDTVGNMGMKGDFFQTESSVRLDDKSAKSRFLIR